MSGLLRYVLIVFVGVMHPDCHGSIQARAARTHNKWHILSVECDDRHAQPLAEVVLLG